jgi:hypothetical protein
MEWLDENPIQVVTTVNPGLEPEPSPDDDGPTDDEGEDAGEEDGGEDEEEEAEEEEEDSEGGDEEEGEDADEEEEGEGEQANEEEPDEEDGEGEDDSSDEEQAADDGDGEPEQDTAAADGDVADSPVADLPLDIPMDPHVVLDYFIDWMVVRLVDANGDPVAGARVLVTPVNGQPQEYTLGDDGTVHVEGIDPLTTKISFPDYDASSWDKAGIVME